jgi:cytochrome c-type biogenesis protein CcmH
MSLWLILGAMGAAVATILFLGLRRQSVVPSDAADHDLAVYRAQLDELDRDRERGVLEDSELESARLEVQRRMLAADARRGRAGDGASAKAGWGLPLALALGIPLGAGALYLWLGNPAVDSEPFAERQERPAPSAEGGEPLPDVTTMMARLRERLAEQPGDLQGWINLGRAAFVLDDYGEAITAYGRALAIDGDLGHLHAALGEAHVMSAGGIVTEAARRAFEAAVARDPMDPRARFYLAIAREQDGDKEGALAVMTALVDDAPADASWAEGVRQRAAAIAQDLGLDPADILPPEAADVAASPEDVEQLAARLENDPKDYQGWIELARLRVKSGDREGAQAALQRGAEVYAGAPFVQQQLRQAAVELGLEGAQGTARGPSTEDMAAASEMSPDEQQEMIRGMVAGLAARLEDDPQDAQGWRMLGRSYGVLGEPGNSAEAFGRAAELLPDDMEAQLDYATALLEAAGSGAPPPEAVARLERIVARDPSNPDALYYLGEVAQRQGDTAGAALYWQRLLAQFPADSEDHAWLKGRIEALKTNN